ncbi:MAG: NfeD family protein [Acutalibacteraceae bacterium]|nr:NfeD family protein [Acutalibacteraceae bacterium]
MEALGFPIMWIVIAVVAAIIEGCTAQLVSVWFAIGAFVTAIVSVFTDNVIVHLAVFVAVSVICIAVTRPLAKKLRSSTGDIPTNCDRYVGKIADVIVNIDNTNAVGQVKVEGSVWSARSSTGEPLPVGTRVIVNSIEGVKMIVTPVNVPQTAVK